MKNVFITGGCGFVGYHLTRRLLDTPGVERIRVFDNLSSGFQTNLPNDPRVDLTVGSVRDFDKLRAWMNPGYLEPDGFDTVFHLAANPDIARAAQEPRIDFDQGTVLTQNVLEAARVNRVARVVFFSGSGVYGDRGETWLTEEMAGNPVSPYGAAKLAGEALLSAYCAMFGIQGLTFRMANIVGPRQTHGVGYDFLRKLKADPTKLDILGDGRQSKSYIHIDDVLNAVIGAVHRQEAGKLPRYDCFNVGTDDWMSVNEIADRAYLISVPSQGQILKRQFSGGSTGWNGDVPVVRLNCSKIQSAGWRAERNSTEAMDYALRAMKEELG